MNFSFRFYHCFWFLAIVALFISCQENTSSPHTDDRTNENSSQTNTSSFSLSSSALVLSSVTYISSSSSIDSGQSPTSTVCAVPNSIRINAAGASFTMGSNVMDLLVRATTRRDSAMVQSLAQTGTPENAVHTVHFTKDFQMDATETTQQQLLCLLEQAGYMEIAQENRAHWEQWVPALTMGPQYPAWGISAELAAMVANLRSIQDSLQPAYLLDTSNGNVSFSTIDSANGWRLPTEAQWEFAARATSTTDFPWNASWSSTLSTVDSAEISDNSIWAGNSFVMENSPAYGPQPVSSKNPNAFGLYDMVGNLSEWCEDFYHFEGYPAIDRTNPLRNDDGFNGRVIRGGNWTNSPLFLRVSNRTFSGGTYPPFSQGMRLVRNL